MTEVIKTAGLTKRYGRVEAVRDLNLRVPEGAIYAFVGPNGAGKTTTIKILMNIFQASGGTAEVLGKGSTKVAGKVFQAIGYVSENQQMPEWMMTGALLQQCRAAVRRPGAMASVAGTTESCSRAPSEGSSVGATTLHALLWAPEPDVNAGISPVQAFALNFSLSSRLASPEDQRKIVICPGIPMRLAKPKIVGYSRIEFETPEIRLEEHRVDF